MISELGSLWIWLGAVGWLGGEIVSGALRLSLGNGPDPSTAARDDDAFFYIISFEVGLIDRMGRIMGQIAWWIAICVAEWGIFHGPLPGLEIYKSFIHRNLKQP